MPSNSRHAPTSPSSPLSCTECGFKVSLEWLPGWLSTSCLAGKPNHLAQEYCVERAFALENSNAIDKKVCDIEGMDVVNRE